MSRTKRMMMKDLSGLLITTLACTVFAGGGISAMPALAGEGGKAAIEKTRLIRVVDLPDVPALHWRGGRYKDLGYLFDKDGTGTWVAYIGPDHYLPLTRRELEEMIRIAAQSGLHVGGGSEAAVDSGDEAHEAAAAQAATPPARPERAQRQDSAAFARDALDMALLPPSDAPVITGSTSPAGQVTAQAVPAMNEPPTNDMKAKPASRSVRAGKTDSGAPATHGAAGMQWTWIAGLGLMAAGIAGGWWMIRRRRRSGQALRERMHHVMHKMPHAAGAPENTAKGNEATGPASGRAQATGAAGHAEPLNRQPMPEPDEALRAMQAAARGGLAT